MLRNAKTPIGNRFVPSLNLETFVPELPILGEGNFVAPELLLRVDELSPGSFLLTKSYAETLCSDGSADRADLEYKGSVPSAYSQHGVRFMNIHTSGGGARRRSVGEVAAKILHADEAVNEFGALQQVNSFEERASLVRGVEPVGFFALVDGSGIALLTRRERITSLQARLETGGKLTRSLVEKLAGTMALGLAEIHSRGVSHDDVHPRNYHLKLMGHTVIVTDFGCASWLDVNAATKIRADLRAALIGLRQVGAEAAQEPFISAYFDHVRVSEILSADALPSITEVAALDTPYAG